MTTRPFYPGWFSPPPKAIKGGQLSVDLVNLQPIRWRGDWALLAAVPGCWCGKKMAGYPLPFEYEGSTDFNWLCDEHGNDGLSLCIFWIEGRSPTYVSMLSNWDMEKARVIEVDKATGIMRAVAQPEGRSK